MYKRPKDFRRDDAERPVLLRMVLPLLFLFAAASCGGGGSGGSSGGGSYAGDSDPTPTNTVPDPTLSSIQDEVFTPICTECHAGANAPQGLRLEEGMSYGMLVNVASSEVPSLDRVEPGNPDDSYLVRKIEGTASVGERMPLGGPYLSADTIAAIRQWISDGAMESVASKPAGEAVALKAAWPVPGSSVDGDTRQLLLIASGELDTTLVNDRSIRLFRITGDSSQPVDGIRLAVTSLDPTVITVIPDKTLEPGSYELRASGGGTHYLADRAGRLVDGDGDGRPGGDLELAFDIER